MFRLSGWLYDDGRFREGSVTVKDGTIAEVGRRKARDALATGLILPAFVNAHSHAGDAVVREELLGTLEELVAPPHGLKHRVLAKSTDAEVVDAARGYLESMLHGGTTSFWDFREMGLRGLRQLYAATIGLPLRPFLFGRPANLSYDREEVRALLRVADGIGISSLLDWDPSDAAKLAADAHAAKKPFALHASERVREDIDGVLDLRPDLLVHLTEATNADLERVADAHVPVAVCPRSQAFFGKLIDLPRMERSGLRLMLGTDNAMINAPSVLREMEFAWKTARLHGGIAPRAVLEMALEGRRGLDGAASAEIAPGEAADLIVLRMHGGHPTFGSVFRADETDVTIVSTGGRTWLRKNGGAGEILQGEKHPVGKSRTRPARRRK